MDRQVKARDAKIAKLEETIAELHRAEKDLLAKYQARDEADRTWWLNQFGRAGASQGRGAERQAGER